MGCNSCNNEKLQALAKGLVYYLDPARAEVGFERAEICSGCKRNENNFCTGRYIPKRIKDDDCPLKKW